MRKETEQNLKGLAKITILLSGILVGSIIEVKSMAHFDSWSLDYLDRVEKEKYLENHSQSDYQLNYEERK